MAADDPASVTAILARVRAGDPAAIEDLYPAVYEPLRGLARGMLRRERADHTLQATALIHEAYLKLADLDRAAPEDRAHFFGIAARCMRQILVDHARRKNADKRGAAWDRVALDVALAGLEHEDIDVIAIDAALERLAEQDPRKARVVELRFFGGMTLAEVAEALGVSLRTAEGDWYLARAWLRKELGA